jgi:putative transposase
LDYLAKNHSKYLTMAHLIFVCKYRKRLLTPFGDQVKYLMASIAREYGFTITEMEADKDHIHLLVNYPPTLSLLQIVRLLKQITTYRLWRTGNIANYLRMCFWKERTFWSDGYFVCSIGNASPDTIRQYIRNQG